MIPKKEFNRGSFRLRLNSSPFRCSNCGKVIKVKGSTNRASALEKCKKCLFGK